MSVMRVEYNGTYPNLCRGSLFVTVDGKRWEFPPNCLQSGGSVSFDREWVEHVERGPWLVTDWPDGFPEEQKKAVRNAVNTEIPKGCCGGCV